MFEQLTAALERAEPIIDGRHPVPAEGMRKAAVLILLTNEADPRLILTERAAHLRRHAGQVSFPGGSRDGQETPEQTALREAMEECAIDAGGVRILGRLPASSLPVTAFAVTPVVGVWDSAVPLEFVADPVEVADIHTVPVSALVDPANRGSWVLSGERAAAAARSEGGNPEVARQMRYTGPVFVYGEVVIWGFTAMLLDGLLELAGWAQPWDHNRIIEVPRRFRGR